MQTETTELERLANQQATQSQGASAKISQAFQIATHYRWSQIARRLTSTVKNKVIGKRVVGEISTADINGFQNTQIVKSVATAIIDSYQQHLSHHRNDLQRGQLNLLNEPKDLGWPFNWRSVIGSSTHLWRFQLQYHEYLLSWLADHPKDNQLAWQVVEDWIQQHAPEATVRNDDSWHPYCISRRLPVWIWMFAANSPPEHLGKRIENSMAQQAMYLRQNLELDLRGNHLFENLSTLALVAFTLWKNPTLLFDKHCQSLLRRELQTQVLETGEHFERSPMYHCQILGNILKMIAVIRSADAEPVLLVDLQRAAESMAGWLQTVLHPDGEIPLFGDSGFGEAPSVSLLQNLAGQVGIDLSIEHPKDSSDYWPYRSSTDSNADFLLFDRGEICPRQLPAHGHCDLLGFEASVAGKRWFVDSGNFDYEGGPMRQYCRSSMAHNVITVEGQNQCEIWSKFRMGRRGTVLKTDDGIDAGSGFRWASAWHDAYRKQGFPQVGRMLAVNDDTENPTWICIDCLKTSKGRAANSDRQKVPIGYLHLAPSLAATEDPNGFLLSDGQSQRRLIFFGTDKVQLMEGWYCPAFGVRERSQVLVYQCKHSHSQPNSPCTLGWVLHNDLANPPEVVSSQQSIQIQFPEHSEPFIWNL